MSKPEIIPFLQRYDLFLFDFDGLLVNTEEIHFLAYRMMCEARGYHLDWSFPFYCQFAHYDAHLLKEAIYKKFPALHVQEPDWSILYAEKKKAVIQLLEQGAVQLMPDVEPFLRALHSAKKTSCVVTNSPQELIHIIRQKNPLLSTIQHWITREHYTQPKPHPEGYLKAIELLAKPHEQIIGFEDTPRGLTALCNTRAQPVLICQVDYPEIPQFIQKGVLHYPSFAPLINIAP